MTATRQDVKPPVHKTYATFNTSKQFVGTETISYQHSKWIVTKPSKSTSPSDSKRENKKWFCKQMKDEILIPPTLAAKIETIAQEFNRLLMPWHPKTRWLVKPDNSIHVLSEYIEGFSDFENEHAKTNDTEFKNKIFQARTDFAEILVTALFLNEFDLRAENIGFDSQGRIIKIDGECCFAQIDPFWSTHTPYRFNSHKISSNDLESLPNLSEYNPSNWLSIINGDSTGCSHRDNEEYLNLGLATNAEFRNAINRAILKIILLPDELLRNFVHCYDNNEETYTLLTDFMINQRKELQIAALNSPSFCKYLASNAPQQDLNDFMSLLKQFKTMNNYILMTDVPHAAQFMSDSLRNLQTPPAKQSLSPLQTTTEPQQSLTDIPDAKQLETVIKQNLQAPLAKQDLPTPRQTATEPQQQPANTPTAKQVVTAAMTAAMTATIHDHQAKQLTPATTPALQTLAAKQSLLAPSQTAAEPQQSLANTPDAEQLTIAATQNLRAPLAEQLTIAATQNLQAPPAKQFTAASMHNLHAPVSKHSLFALAKNGQEPKKPSTTEPPHPKAKKIKHHKPENENTDYSFLKYGITGALAVGLFFTCYKLFSPTGEPQPIVKLNR